MSCLDLIVFYLERGREMLDMESEEQKERNRLELAAWNAWKDVCWVHGLGRQLEHGKPVVGTSEQEAILAKKINWAFRKKLAAFGNCFEAEGLKIGDDVDFAEEFDAALREFEVTEINGEILSQDRRCKGEARARKPKHWKDDVWHAIAESEDAPLAVIRGKLLGKRGVINDIVENWILKNYSARIRRVKNEEGKLVDALIFYSQDAEQESPPDDYVRLNADGEITTEMADADGGNVSEEEGREDSMDLDRIMPEAIDKKFKESLSVKICCILLADAYRIALYADEEVLSALGIRKSTANSLLKKASEIIHSLDVETRFWLMDHPTEFKKWLRKQIEPEKAGQIILSRIEARKRNA